MKRVANVRLKNSLPCQFYHTISLDFKFKKNCKAKKSYFSRRDTCISVILHKVLDLPSALPWIHVQWSLNHLYFLQPFVTDEPVAKDFSINNMVMEERMRQGQPPPWHEVDDIDSTRVSTNMFTLFKQ